MTRSCLLLFLASLFVCHHSNAQWEALNGPPGSNVQDMERTPDGTLYLISDFTVFTSIDNADSWQKMTVESRSDFTLQDLTFDAAGNLYGVNYSRFYESTDKGLNWELVSNDGDFYGTHIQIFGPDDFFLIYGANGIFVSTNKGVSWKKIWDKQPYDLKTNVAGDIFITTSNDSYDKGLIMRYTYPGSSAVWDVANWFNVYTSSGNSGYDMRLLIDRSSNVYASVYSDVILSANNGTDWTSVRGNITEPYFVSVVWAEAQDGTIYLTNTQSLPFRMYSTTTQGTTWTIGNSPTDTYGSIPTRICFGSSSTIFVGSSGDGVLRSTNGGANWQLASAGLLLANGRDIEVANDGRIIYLTNNRQKGYWTSTDGGASWTFVGIADYVGSILKLSDGKLLLFSGGPVYASADNGASFLKIDDTYINAITQAASGKLYGADSNALYTSADGGDNWTSLTGIVTGLPTTYYSYLLSIDAANSNLFLWLFNYEAGRKELYRIAVGGGAAILIDPGLWNANVTDVSNVFVSGTKLYVAAYDAIYESADNGSTWSTIGFSGLRAFPIEGALAVSQNGFLYTTQDDGKSWNSSALPTRNAVIFDMVKVPGGFVTATTNSSALKFTGQLLLPPDQLPTYIDFNWQPTNGPYGGPISTAFSDNSKNSYVLSSGRLFKTTTFDQWQKLTLSPQGYVYDAVYDKANNKIYALQDAAIQRSSDGGVTWNVITADPFSCALNMVKCTNGAIAVATRCTYAKVWVSTNDGLTFGNAKLALSTTDDFVTRMVSTSSSAILVRIYNPSTEKLRLIRSKDNGDTWEDVATPIPGFQVGTDDNGRLFIYGSGQVYRSVDDGENWENLSGDLANGYVDYNAQPTYNSSGDLFLTGYHSGLSRNGFWKTSNDGANWAFIPSDWGALCMHSLGTRMIAGTLDGVYSSDDACVTFTERSTGIYPREYSDLEMLRPTEMVAVANADSYRSTDFQNWSRSTDLNTSNFFKNPDGTLIAWGTHDIFTTPDKGINWIKAGSSSDNITNFTSADGNLYFIVTTAGKIRYTNDFQLWNDLQITGLPKEYFIFGLAAHPSGSVLVSLYNYDVQQYEAYQILYGSAIRINGVNRPRNFCYNYKEGKVLMYDEGGAIFETMDGSDWTSRSAPTGDKLIVTEKGYYFISQFNRALWLSRNEGQTWQSVGAGANVHFTDIVVNEYDGHAYAEVDNAVIYKSGSIIIPPETTAPLVTAFSPLNNSTGVAPMPQLSITFDEVVNPVAGKKIRILDLGNPINPVAIIDAATGIREAKTFSFTPPTPLTFEKTYFVVIDNGAFTDIFGNAYNGFTANSTWRFTIQAPPDISKPTITYSAATPAFIKGASNNIQISVVDEEGGTAVDDTSVKIFYRGIMSSDALVSATLTHTSGNTFEASVPDNWMDDLGLEFNFQAADHAGNIQTLPDDGSYYRGYISFPAALNPALPSTVLSFGGQLENYRVFSIPYKLNDGTISTIFNELSGQTVKADFRILHFNTQTDKYLEYPTLSIIARGLGYWINIKTATTIAVENASTPENSKEAPASLSLEPGWNQIGNPYPFTISWNAVKSVNANIGAFKTFNGSTFVDDDKINPFEGGFVLLSGTSPINVSIPFTAKTSAGRSKGETRDWDQGWLLPITVTNSKFHSVGGVGMHPDANIGFDRYDDAMPPKIFPLPELVFEHSEHFLKHFTRDVVSPQNEFVWYFTIDGGEEQAVLSWDASKVTALAHDLYLLDIDQQKLVDMSENEQYEISGNASAFKLYYGISREKIKPSRIILGKPYPNPFTGQSHISFTLPENTAGSYRLTLELYNALGQKIATLAQGQYSAGFYVADWNPEPTTVHSSVYLVRLVASDKKSTVVLTEKIISKQ